MYLYAFVWFLRVCSELLTIYRLNSRCILRSFSSIQLHSSSTVVVQPIQIYAQLYIKAFANIGQTKKIILWNFGMKKMQLLPVIQKIPMHWSRSGHLRQCIGICSSLEANSQYNIWLFVIYCTHSRWISIQYQITDKWFDVLLWIYLHLLHITMTLIIIFSLDIFSFF